MTAQDVGFRVGQFYPRTTAESGSVLDARQHPSRFMEVDPVIQAPLNSQSLNPYSYILNNPLSGTDPTGYVSSCEGAAGDRSQSCQLQSRLQPLGKLESDLHKEFGGGAAGQNSRAQALFASSDAKRNRDQANNGASSGQGPLGAENRQEIAAPSSEKGAVTLTGTGTYVPGEVNMKEVRKLRITKLKEVQGEPGISEQDFLKSLLPDGVALAKDSET